MLSDEEKQVVDYLIFHKYENSSKKEDMIDKIIEIIEKQSKEIEDNKKYIDLHYVPYEQYTSKLNELNKKWKDKIKAEIEEINEKLEYGWESEYEYCKEVLQSLLEKE